MTPEADRPFQPDWVCRPGGTIEDCMQHHGYDVATASAHLAFATVDFVEVLRGAAPIDAQAAERLAVVFGGPPDFWLGLQARYESECVRLGKTDLEDRDALLARLATLEAP